MSLDDQVYRYTTTHKTRPNPIGEIHDNPYDKYIGSLEEMLDDMTDLSNFDITVIGGGSEKLFVRDTSASTVESGLWEIFGYKGPVNKTKEPKSKKKPKKTPAGGSKKPKPNPKLTKRRRNQILSVLRKRGGLAEGAPPKFSDITDEILNECPLDTSHCEKTGAGTTTNSTEESSDKTESKETPDVIPISTGAAMLIINEPQESFTLAEALIPPTDGSNTITPEEPISGAGDFDINNFIIGY